MFHFPDDESLCAEIRHSEEQLLRPDIRGSREDLERLLADDFLEFGASGQTYGKRQIIDNLCASPEGRYSITGFQVRRLAADVAQVVYRGAYHTPDRKAEYSLRTSIWRFEHGRWRMIYHQGTSLPDEEVLPAA